MNRPPDPNALPDRTAVQQTSPPADTKADPAVGELPRFGPPAGPNELGTLGRYRVLRLLGKGGMGAVYKAHDPRLDRDVALKVMLPGAAGNPLSRERFLREARSAARVLHDHVIGILDADETAGTPYIAMPYLRGYPLDDYLAKKGRPPLPQVLRLVREMCDGLAAAHALGIVHRDIKPGNVWLESPNGRVKLLDFGLAKPTDENDPDGTDLTRTGALLGTPAYMAPEQGCGRPVGPKADLFSVGCVLYRLLCDAPPFARPSVMATLTALAVETPIPIRARNPQVPPALAALVDDLLQKDPDRRPATAAVVVERLRAIERGAVAPTTGPSAGSPAEPVAVPAEMFVSAGGASAFDNLTDDGPGEPSVHRSAVREPAGRPNKGLLLAAAGGGLAVLVLAGVLAVKLTRKPTPTADDPHPAVAEKPKKTPDPKPRSTTPKPPPRPTGPLVTEADLTPRPAAAAKGPFDELDPAAIPAAEKTAWLPKQAVAVVGSTKGWVGDAAAAALVSPDGRWIVRSRAVGVLDTATLRPALIDRKITFDCLAIAPDGKTAAVGHVGPVHGVRLIDLSGPAAKPLRTVAQRSENGTHGVAYLPDGRTLATSTGHGGVYLWDLLGPADSPKTVVHPMGGEFQIVRQLSVSADGTRLAGVCTAPDAAETRLIAAVVWDIAGSPPTEVARVPLDPVFGGSAALAPDGRTLVVTRLQNGPAMSGLEVWDVSGEKPTKTFELDKLTGPAVRGFAADGSLVTDKAVFKLSAGKLTRTRELPERVVGFAPDLSRLVQQDAGGHRLSLLDGTGAVVAAADPPAIDRDPALGPGQLLTADGTPTVWTPAAGAMAATPLPDPLGPLVRGRGLLNRPRFNHDGGKAAGVGADAVLYVYQLGDAPRQVLAVPTGTAVNDPANRATGYDWLPDGGLAVRAGDGTVTRWEADTAGLPGRLLAEGPEGPGKGFVVHPSGRLFAWIDAEGNVCLLKPGTPPADAKQPAAPPPADVRTIPFPAGEGMFKVLDFSADGRHLYACNNNHKLRRYDLTKTEPAEELLLGQDCEWFFRSADGRTLVTKSTAGETPTIVWRDADTLKVRGEYRPPLDTGFKLAPDGRHLLVRTLGVGYLLRLDPPPSAP